MQMTVQIQFTNKSSFYIALSVDFIFDILPSISVTFTEMAVQLPFMNHCSFYINFNCLTVDLLLDYLLLMCG